MPLPHYVSDKSRQELLELLCSGIEPGSVLQLQADAAFRAKVVEDAEKAIAGLEQAIRDATASSDSVAGKLFWLNVVLAVATVVGAAAAAWSALN
jgi:hypothetical protein